MKAILDVNRLRIIRLERGLSQRALAQQLGTTTTVIRSLEDGRNHNDLSLRFVVNLAAALAVDPAALFPRTGMSSEDVPGADVRKLGAAFAAAQVGRSRERIARALAWNLDRLDRAMTDLAHSLAAVGMRVERGSTGWKLRPDLAALTWDDELRLEQARHVERGLRLREAELLRATLDAPLDGHWERHIGNADRVALGGLLKTGLVVRGPNGITPSEGVRANLTPNRRKRRARDARKPGTAPTSEEARRAAMILRPSR